AGPSGAGGVDRRAAAGHGGMTLPTAPQADPWAALRRHTPARIAIGRSGTGLPTAEVLRLAADHAAARDAVHLPLDVAALGDALRAQGLQPLPAHSRAATREIYLRRPDLGRRLAPQEVPRLQAAATGPVDLAVVLGDGLSAQAVQRHALPLLLALRAALGDAALRWAPVVVVATQARVALADEVGALLQARVVLMLLGERPGLSSPDSLGAYLTHAPQVGRTDAERNCVSNIRPEGLAPARAAHRIAWLLNEALRRRLSGVALKDDSTSTLVGRAD
ncbi:MAG: ethanolamine ammonia-lyase subunit EutC, partial [Rubrivivax sp.]|nr:ethanolamine ammonia-lyase subunit EutC [Rubrivivax sp.]